MATYRNVNNCQWRQETLKLLQIRNRNQCQCYQDLISLHHRLFESADSLKAQNLQLTVQSEKLRLENLELQSRPDSSGSDRPNDKFLALEQKLFRLQEELTELHRRKGENAQQFIEMRNSLQEKEKELAAKDYKIKDMETHNVRLLEHQKKLEQIIDELEATNQILKDEHQALQLAYMSLEKKFRELHEEHQQLVERWLSQRAQAADMLNDENDTVVKKPGELKRAFSGVFTRLRSSITSRKRQERIRKDLDEAARDTVVINFPERCAPDTYFSCCTSIPQHVLTKFEAHEGEVNAIKWAPSGNVMATGGADRKVKLWEIVKGLNELKGTLTGSNAAITCVDFDSAGTFLIGASNDFASRVWSIADQRVRHVLTGHSGKVLAARFLGNQCRVVSGSHDRTLKIWDLRSHACIRTIFAMSSCFDVATDQAGSIIISGHFDRKIRFWDSRIEATANELQMQGKVTSLDISKADETHLLTCTRDDTLKIVDLRMNQVLVTCSADGFKVGGDSTRAVYSPDGQYVCCGSQDGSFYVWNTADGKLEKTFKEHTQAVNACSWHVGGSLVASCDRNHKVYVWTDS